MNRRDILKTFGIGIAGAAIAAVIPFKSEPEYVYLEDFGAVYDSPILYGDGIHDDTDALQALIDGKPVNWSTGERASMPLTDRTFVISNTLVFKEGSYLEGRNITFSHAAPSWPPEGIVYKYYVQT
jgi:hypothetical protein